MMDLGLSAEMVEVREKIRRFVEEDVAAVEHIYHEEVSVGDRWSHTPKQEEIMETLKAKARELGLWNFFLPQSQGGAGISNLEYAHLAEIMGRSRLASEAFNCSAPDTGNMEVLERYGSEEHKKTWLEPLLAGKIRSAFAMTEPDVASSDATNMAATAVVEGDQVILNGTKWWSSGIGDPHCKVGIFMASTPDESKDRHHQHSMVLVPLDTPGVEVVRMLPVFGAYDAPHGHGEVKFTDVRLPVSSFISGPGMGFEIAQGRLGPGRIHHCMRCLGAAEKSLELMVDRGMKRTAFHKPIMKLGGNAERLAEARIAIDQARLLTLFAAWKMDKVGALNAMTEISAIKVVAPNVLQKVVDDAIQIHGGAGVSQDTPLTAFFMQARSLRLADGPDEVHKGVIARIELAKRGFFSKKYN